MHPRWTNSETKPRRPLNYRINRNAILAGTGLLLAGLLWYHLGWGPEASASPEVTEELRIDFDLPGVDRAGPGQFGPIPSAKGDVVPAVMVFESDDALPGLPYPRPGWSPKPTGLGNSRQGLGVEAPNDAPSVALGLNNYEKPNKLRNNVTNHPHNAPSAEAPTLDTKAVFR